LFTGGNSCSLVLYGHTSLCMTYLQRDFNWLIDMGKPERIRKVVCERLPDTIYVGDDCHQIIASQFQFKVSLCCEFLLVCDDFLHYFDEIAPYQRKFKPVCLDA